jgi:RimJ/RimL family protein N-acetyltransferase
MIVGGNQTFASPEEALEHFGVKGMRWGVRKERKARPISGPIKKPIIRKTKNGDTFTMTPQPSTAVERALSRLSSNYRERTSQATSLKITDKNGKKIGDATFWFKGKDDIYLNWIGIKRSARGQGYATEIMKAAAEYGSKTGRKRMVLEVPGNSPDARHIYKKMGFKDTGRDFGSENDVWGGLHEMEYRFDKKEG